MSARRARRAGRARARGFSFPPQSEGNFTPSARGGRPGRARRTRDERGDDAPASSPVTKTSRSALIRGGTRAFSSSGRPERRRDGMVTSAPLGATSRAKGEGSGYWSRFAKGEHAPRDAAREDTAGAVSPMLMVKEAMVGFQVSVATVRCAAAKNERDAGLGPAKSPFSPPYWLRLSSRRSVKRFGGVEP